MFFSTKFDIMIIILIIIITIGFLQISIIVFVVNYIKILVRFSFLLYSKYNEMFNGFTIVITIYVIYITIVF